jgi:hypothetical protein
VKALYVGILTAGTTSRLRADVLRVLCPELAWEGIDTGAALFGSARLWRTTAFRLKLGPVVDAINRRVLAEANADHYALVWVDKGVFLRRRTVEHLRVRAQRLVHFTPDTAFHANRSRHFVATAGLYDLLVTTKSFECDRYAALVGAERVHLTTQGFDADLHRPSQRSADQATGAEPRPKRGVAFVGLCEPDRERCLERLLKAGLEVQLGGRGWERFLSRHQRHPRLRFLGAEIFGSAYVEAYARAEVGLGLLSKRFPERHTTRTFEIPAIGTALATERTPDTERFFGEDEVLFFGDYAELADALLRLRDDPARLARIAERGHRRVCAGGYDYGAILSGVLRRAGMTD